MNWNNKARHRCACLGAAHRAASGPPHSRPADHGRSSPNRLLRTGPALGVEIQRAPLSRTERLAKRVFDFAFAALGLAMLVPLFTVVAIASSSTAPARSSSGKHRTGFNGRKFSIYKFRTMTTMDNGAVVRQATRNDARVTRVGRVAQEHQHRRAAATAQRARRPHVARRAHAPCARP